MASYLDGELSLGARALFDAHLDQCDECTRELTEMRDTIRLLRTLPTPEPPTDLVSNVMSRIAEGEGQPNWFERVMDQLSRIFVPRIAIPATAVAAALTLTFVSGDLNLNSLDPRVRPNQSEIAGISLDARTGDSRRNALPIAADVPRVGNARRAPSQVTVRVASSTHPPRQRNESGAGQFLFRVASDQIGPIRRSASTDDVASRYLFTGGLTGRSPRVGPYLGASAAPPIALGSGQYLVGAASIVGAANIVGAAKVNPNSQNGAGAAVTRASATTQAAAPRANLVSAAGQTELTSEQLREQVLDQRLNALVLDPPGFAHRQAKRSQAEQEHWLQQMAARAADLGDVERVMSALAGSGDPEAKELASKFNLAVARNGENIANIKASASLKAPADSQ
jgi:hypothetical protein